uniref:Uncharacterized protein n=1 Tax=Anguilla anguilla TaxID=7936 RepID=A0A0E9WF64_ANGAN
MEVFMRWLMLQTLQTLSSDFHVNQCVKSSCKRLQFKIL